MEVAAGCDLNLGQCLVGPCAVPVLAGRGPRSAGYLGTAHWESEHSLAFFNGTLGHLIYTSYLTVAADDFETTHGHRNLHLRTLYNKPIDTKLRIESP